MPGREAEEQKAAGLEGHQERSGALPKSHHQPLKPSR